MTKKPLIDPRYTFPVGMLMTLFGYHVVLTKWDTYPALPFWFAIIGFIGMLGLTVGTFYKVANNR